MTPAEIALLVFTVCNSARLFAFVPQIVAIWRDRHGASAVSCTSWGLFGVSHLATVAYALLDKGDWNMAAIFGANAGCCGLIIGLTLWKRADHRAASRSQRYGAGVATKAIRA